MIYKTLHRKLKIEQNEPHREQMVNSGAPERQAASSPLVTPLSHRLKLYNIIHKLRASLYFCWYKFSTTDEKLDVVILRVTSWYNEFGSILWYTVNTKFYELGRMKNKGKPSIMLHFSGKILNKVRQLAFQLQIALIHTNLFFFISKWASNCCLTSIQQFFSYIMSRTS